MKNTIKTKILLFLFIAILALSPICIATDVVTTSSDLSAEVTSDDIVDDTHLSNHVASDLYLFDDELILDSIVDGNAFIFGNDVTVSGEIGGDLFVFGNNVTLTETAYIYGSIFVYAKNFEMNGICYDIYSASQKFTLGKSAIVVRDIKSVAEKININGQIRRNAYITTNELVFPENASNLILGNLEYSSDSEFVINEGIVGGEIKFNQEVTKELTVAENVKTYVRDILSTILYSLAVILLTIWMAPKFKEKSSLILKKRAPLSFGVGLLASIAIIVGSIVLIFVTGGLGVGISVAAITLFILVLTISKTVFSMACAKLVSKKFKKDNNAIFIGMSLLFVLAISLIELIPYVGGLVGFAVVMIGLGILLLSLIGRKNLEDTKVEEVISVATEENK